MAKSLFVFVLSHGEIQWVKIKTKHNTITVGNFYGPQENEKRQKVKTIYRNLRTQIIQAKQECPVILTGDFNAKLHITKQGNTIQNESNNGKIMQNEILKGAGMYPASTHPTIGTWTRQTEKNTTEKSVIDYILVSSTQKRIIENIEIDELGTLRIKGKNYTDHNTITATILTECSNPHTTTKRIKINNKEGWDTTTTTGIQQQDKRNGTK